MKHATAFKALLLLPFALGVACNPSDERAFKNAGNQETVPVPTLLPSANALSGGGAAPTEAASITYLIRVKTNSDATLCNGEATIKLMSDFNVLVPNGIVQCNSLKIDLSGLLGGDKGLTGGQDTNAAASGGKLDNLYHDGKLFSIGSLMGATFTPPRPILLGPIVQNPDDYNNFDRTTKHHISGADPKTGAQVETDVTFHVHVDETKGFYKNDHIDKPFENVLHWNVATSDLSNANFPPNLGLIVEKIEWWWNTRPIMIPQVVITGNLDNFIVDDTGAAEQIVGRVTLTLLVKEYKIAN